MKTRAEQDLPGWGWPIAIVIAVHLLLVALPIEFPQAHSDEPAEIRLTMIANPAPEPPPTLVEEPQQEEPPPEPVEEPPPPPEPAEVEEQLPEPEPEPEPEPTIVADQPEISSPESEVAIAEEKPIVDVDEVVDEVIDEPVEEETETETEEKVEDIDDVTTTEETALPPAPSPPSLSEPQPSPEPVEINWQGYGRGVVDAVQSHQNYPRMAERMQWEGTAIISVNIDRNGDLIEPPKLVESSQHEVLDEEALRMAKSAAPFQAFPSGAQEEKQELVIPVRFQLR